MVRKIAMGLAVLLVLGGAGMFVWARSVLATDEVRAALARQISTSLGQPVTVDGIRASIFPRPSVTLTGVSIGAGSRVTVETLDVGANLGALLSRRIEAGTLHIDGARISLPLPLFSFGAAGAASAERAGQTPVRLDAIDEVVLTNVQVVSRGRTIRGTIDLVRHGTSGATVRAMTLVADGARIDATGDITDLAGPVGTFDLKAGALDLDQMMAFASDMWERSGAPASAVPASPAPAGWPTAIDLTVTLSADRATLAGIALDGLKGRARLQGDQLKVDPLTFNLFGGRYEGTIGASLAGEPSLTWTASVKNIDVADVMAFAGNPGVMTGRLTADVDLAGRGIDAAGAMRTARGTARVAIANGSIRNLALVRGSLAATSLDPQAVVTADKGQHDEPFSELTATLGVFAGTASTQDLHFTSKDIRLDAGGALKLDGSAIALQGAVRLSEELSKQAADKVAGFTKPGGQVTLPISIKGSVAKYSLEISR